MMKRTATANGTQSYARLHKRGLTLTQQNAVDLLAGGKNDTEAAEVLNLSRVTVTRWRCYDPVFIAALNARRSEIWGVGVDRLRTLIPKALDVLAGLLECDDAPIRLKAADTVLRLAELPAGSGGIGPHRAEDVVRGVVTSRRKDSTRQWDAMMEDSDLPPFERHMEETWAELEALANEGENGVATDSAPGSKSA